MVDLGSRLEVTKLAHRLRASEDDLAFLASSSPEQLRELRTTLSDALAARHDDLVDRLAGLTRLLPVALAARIAQHALGPALSARVAAALDPHDAARLAAHLDPDFLARLAAHVDPARVERLITALPRETVLDTGRRLLADGEHLALARLLAVVDTDLAMDVVAGASAGDLLQVLLLSDDRAARDTILARLGDATVEAVTAAAEAEGYSLAEVRDLIGLTG